MTGRFVVNWSNEKAMSMVDVKIFGISCDILLDSITRLKK